MYKQFIINNVNREDLHCHSHYCLYLLKISTLLRNCPSLLKNYQ